MLLIINMRYCYLLSVLLLLGFDPATCDTPADCRYEDIQGDWTFSETERYYNAANISCDELGSVVRSFQIKLSYPDIAEDEYGNKGTWTLIYNQGFEVTVNHRTYFAFSLYQQTIRKAPCSKKDVSGCKIKEAIRVTSICDKTFPGWSHDTLVNNWACFKGEKVQAMPPRRHVVTHNINSEMYRSNPAYLAAINSAQSSWRAKAYPEYEEMTHEQLLMRRGGRKSSILRPPSPAAVTEKTRRESKALPDAFDWRDLQGVSFVPPIRAQGNCGSCYAFGSTAALEARLRIKTNNKLKVTLSTQDVVSCSKYSQGCSGGFPYLVAGKYGMDFGFVSEECYPYEGKDSPCQKVDCPRHYTAAYKYVGGYYGACNEDLMKIALVKDGPLAVSFMVYGDFHAYSGGIYHHTGLTDEFDPFEITNHVVSIVGYGADAESGEKFWIVQNSWGETWGEDGFFRIRRGDDQCAIESIAVELNPIP